MKKTFLTLSLASFFMSGVLDLNAQQKSQAKQSVSDTVLSNRISEEQFVRINGIEQWITIKGDRSKPVILFLHGGPGSVMSPYSDNLYRQWEKEFVIVQWDQRGAGRTFGKNAPEELTPAFLQENPLSVEQIAADGIQVSEYLIKHLGKRKVILFGTSWGSIVGVTMASKRPDLYYAYVGHSQVVAVDDLSLYNSVLKQAKEQNDQQSLEVLESIGLPPYARAATVGKLFRIVKKYERAASTPPPADWFIEAPAYDNKKDNQDRELGDDYSFANFAGDQQLGVKSMRNTVNFMQHNLKFGTPVYLMQGAHDLLTPKEQSTRYFNAIQAPAKKYFLMPTAAHGFNAEVLETQYKIFKSIKAS